MMSTDILVLAECQRGRLAPAAAHLAAAGSKLGAVTLLLPGNEAAAAEAAALEGVKTVLHLPTKAGTAHPTEDLAQALKKKADGFSHILAAASSFGFNLIPYLAALLESAPVTDVVAIEDSRTFLRPVRAGNALAAVHTAGDPVLLTLRPHAFPAVGPRTAGNPAPIAPFPPLPERELSRFVTFIPSPGERPELGSARIVVAGGRGLVGNGDQSGLALLTALADRLGAAIGASRGAVDAGLMPNDWQLGQTGKVIAPDLYIGVGISGAIQHLAGIKDAKVIVAINSDPGAPLLAVADYALRGDLFEVLPELERILAKEIR